MPQDGDIPAVTTMSNAAMTHIPADQARRSETPNAVMTTLASPTQGGAGLALWRVEMAPGATGPEHLFDVEQIWTVLDGSAVAVVDGAPHPLAPGDTLILRGGQVRRIQADPEAGFIAVVAAAPGARALLTDGADRGVPPWIA